MLSTRSKARLGARAAKGLALNEGIRDVAAQEEIQDRVLAAGHGSR
jgi:hypothetical protein